MQVIGERTHAAVGNPGVGVVQVHIEHSVPNPPGWSASNVVNVTLPGGPLRLRASHTEDWDDSLIVFSNPNPPHPE